MALRRESILLTSPTNRQFSIVIDGPPCVARGRERSVDTGILR